MKKVISFSQKMRNNFSRKIFDGNVSLNKIEKNFELFGFTGKKRVLIEKNLENINLMEKGEFCSL